LEVWETKNSKPFKGAFDSFLAKRRNPKRGPTKGGNYSFHIPGITSELFPSSKGVLGHFQVIKLPL